MTDERKPESEEIVSLNAEELDAEQLDEVAGGTAANQAELADGGCNVNCGINW
jgi:hypothetical protein